MEHVVRKTAYGAVSPRSQLSPLLLEVIPYRCVIRGNKIAIQSRNPTSEWATKPLVYRESTTFNMSVPVSLLAISSTSSVGLISIRYTATQKKATQVSSVFSELFARNEISLQMT